MKKSNKVKGIAIGLFVFAVIMLLGAANAYFDPSITGPKYRLISGVVLFGIIPIIIGLLVYKKALKIQKEEKK
jgi:tetrahydromethanopterin S-methyltransferase subunit F